MAYTKVASGIKTVGQLKGVLTQFSNKDNIFFAGAEGFSIAVSEDGKVLLDDDISIDGLCVPEELPFR